MNTRGMDGIDAAFAGICPSCGENTVAFRGDADKVADAVGVYQQMIGQEGTLGVQNAAGERVNDAL